MRGSRRILVRLLVVSGLIAAITAITRGVLSRLAGESGANGHAHGSFDSWPAVSPAPDRRPPNGSQSSDAT